MPLRYNRPPYAAITFWCSNRFFLALAYVTLAQTEQTSITGTVTDSSKAIVPDASVTVRNVATNVTTKTTTNAAGLYFLTSLPPGTYELTVEKPGFRLTRVENIPLTTGLAATQDVVPTVGTLSQAVQVSASAVQLEAQSADMNAVITSRPVAELPILGRDPLSFAALVPGVIPTEGQQSNAGVIGRVTTAQIGGGLAQQNGVLIDGAESRGTTESGNATQFRSQPSRSSSSKLPATMLSTDALPVVLRFSLPSPAQTPCMAWLMSSFAIIT